MKLHQLSEIAKEHKINSSTLQKRCKSLGFKKSSFKGNLRYLLDNSQVRQVLGYINSQNKRVFMIEIPEIIYVHTIFEIRESKINFEK